MLSRYRHAAILMAALSAMSTAGAAAAAPADAAPAFPDDGKVRLEHSATKQVCVFDDQGAADDFLAKVEGAADWAQIVHTKPINKVVEVDLKELRTQLDADNAAAAAAGTTDTGAGDDAAAPATTTEPAPAAAEAAPAAPKTTRTRKAA